MTQIDEQFEHIMDEALVLATAGKSRAEILALFPEHAAELDELLMLAENTREYFVDQRAQTTLHELLKKIPAAAPRVGEKKSFTDILFARPFAFSAAVILIALVFNIAPHKQPKAAVSSVATQTTFSQAGMAGMQAARGFSKISLPSTLSFAPQSDDRPNISDTREFIKTAYHATIRTRHVAELTDRLTITIRGFGGRVDSYSANERGGYIAFIIPKYQFEKFKQEVDQLAGARFITQFEDGQNLLWKKINIENEEDALQQQKLTLETQRASLIQQHDAAIKKINNRIAYLTREITKVPEFTTQDIEKKRKNHINERAALYAQRAQRQSEHAAQLAMIDEQLREYANEATRLSERTADLHNDVETISGTITLEDINWFDVLTTYIPRGWLITAAILGAYFWWRGRRRTLHDS